MIVVLWELMGRTWVDWWGVTTDHSGAGVDERGTGGGTWEV